MNLPFESSPILMALAATVFTYIVTAAGAGTVFFFKNINQKILDLMMGFAAGVMIAASFWSLLLPAIELLEEMYIPNTKIRLIGVRVDKLIDEEQSQLSLFEKDTKQENIDKVLDSIKDKYGYEIVTRARKINIDERYKLKKKQ